MKILIDMNLSPDGVDEFAAHQINAIHWSSAGKFDAPDKNLIDWAKEHNHIIFTHDLDFGTALALTRAEKPSVIQVRTQNVTVSHLSKIVLETIKTHADLLEKRALLVIDEDKQRVRILPI